MQCNGKRHLLALLLFGLDGLFRGQRDWHVTMTSSDFLDFLAGSWGRGKRTLCMAAPDFGKEMIDNAKAGLSRRPHFDIF